MLSKKETLNNSLLGIEEGELREKTSAVDNCKQSGNSNLHKAKEKKNDEFFTQLYDIENEIIKYKEYLKDKTIYCNCDDPAWSNFVRYFIMQFNFLGLKRLIATGYIQGNNSLTNQLELFNDDRERKSYCIDIKSVSEKLQDFFVKNAKSNLSNYELLKLLKKDNFIRELKEDGDFRNDESIKLLKQVDIVITNPPFSLFREYVEQLMTYNKEFLIIGNKNAITYKEIFKYIKENKIWMGYNNVKNFY